ncbi:hypothetical protein [Photorhabdus heterorhabditis]|uniref:hypothetical protein n=1 Tax=Photorhabdus heterorhabditis TaxID=880156 RepID=UPI0015621895|nr:hypothetical protein [Photorhabdus heterorhabditis]NRN26865.1 hypothetical protein [Photorhabdus heterorhabditis subsp. aluminescens]
MALSDTAGGAVNSAVQTARTARNESDPRVKAVQAGRLAEAQGSDDVDNNHLSVDRNRSNFIIFKPKDLILVRQSTQNQ